jgi:hypothetical protein
MAGLLAPCVGITRIRFKGSSSIGPLSHSAPPHYATTIQSHRFKSTRTVRTNSAIQNTHSRKRADGDAARVVGASASGSDQ